MAQVLLNSDRLWGKHLKDKHLTIFDKLVFLYLLSNKEITAKGTYPITLEKIAHDTGLTTVEIMKSLNKLSEEVTYINGVVAFNNFNKYATITD